ARAFRHRCQIRPALRRDLVVPSLAPRTLTARIPGRVALAWQASRVAALCLVASSLAGLGAAAQTPPAADTLATVEVTVARAPATSWLAIPLAVTVVHPDSARPGGRDFTLESALGHVPGLLIESRTNPTQDPRISIRGFGSRAAFGVRGVRVLRDGIPLTLADGQTPVDYLELETVG